MNGVTAPERAVSSQASASSSTENTRAPAQASECSAARGVIAAIAAPGA